MLFRWLTERRRARLLEKEFPGAWHEYLTANVKAYKLLGEDEQKHLRDLVQVFIAEKHWEGCGGLELTEEMQVTIAGSACVMILARDHDLLKEIESILVYPSGVVLPDQQASFFDGSPRIIGEGTDALGLAHMQGPMVLAWDSVLVGSRNDRDGRNLVIHEVAHKIDFLDGEADGTPPLDTVEQRRTWARACSEAYLAHKDGEENVLRDYATTNEAEFFAVASEMFFERPKRIAKELPALYAVLRDFYRLDLAARSP
jgi:MtfA peptidase